MSRLIRLSSGNDPLADLDLSRIEAAGTDDSMDLDPSVDSSAPYTDNHRAVDDLELEFAFEEVLASISPDACSDPRESTVLHVQECSLGAYHVCV